MAVTTARESTKQGTIFWGVCLFIRTISLQTTKFGTINHHERFLLGIPSPSSLSSEIEPLGLHLMDVGVRGNYNICSEGQLSYLLVVSQWLSWCPTPWQTNEWPHENFFQIGLSGQIWQVYIKWWVHYRGFVVLSGTQTLIYLDRRLDTLMLELCAYAVDTVCTLSIWYGVEHICHNHQPLEGKARTGSITARLMEPGTCRSKPQPLQYRRWFLIGS